MVLKNIFAALLALLTWFALGLQLYLIKGSLANYFSYFTILCNLLIALNLTAVTLAPKSVMGKFAAKLTVQSAITLYIFIVALVYNTVLRGLVPLAGWDAVANELLHVVIPILFVVYYMSYKTAGNLRWTNGFPWLLFPFFYLVYSLIRGAWVGWYPYPFLNADKFGYAQVFLNIGAMILVFLVGALVLIAISRTLKENTKQG